jgi:hypothetical protein
MIIFLLFDKYDMLDNVVNQLENVKPTHLKFLIPVDIIEVHSIEPRNRVT